MQPLISVGNIIKQSWNVYTSHLSTYLKIAAIALLPIFLFILITLPSKILEPFVLILAVLGVAAMVVLGIWINIIFIKLTQSFLHNEKTELTKISNEAWGVFWSYLWVSILVGVITLLGTLVLIIPGIIFGVWFSFSAIIAVLEKKKGREALSQSKILVQGRFFPVLWRLVAPNAFYGMTMLAVIFVLQAIVGALLGDWKMAFEGVRYYWMMEMISNVVSIFFAPIFIVTVVIFYKNVSQMKHKETSMTI